MSGALSLSGLEYSLLGETLADGRSAPDSTIQRGKIIASSRAETCTTLTGRTTWVNQLRWDEGGARAVKGSARRASVGGRSPPPEQKRALHLRDETVGSQGFGRRGRASWGRAPACPAARPWYHLGRQRLQPSVASCLDGRCTPQPERPPLPDPDAAQPPPQPQSAPSCGGANRGCVQHFEADAFDGGGCLQVRRAQDEGDDGLSLHRLFVCDLKSQSGRLVVVYAVKGVPCDRPCSERRSAELRLALVLRDSPSAEPRMMWVNDCNGHQVQRTSDGSSWEPFNSKTPQTSWQVWEYSVPVRGHVVEIIAGLPPGCKAALIGWLEITDAAPEEICDMSKNARENH